MTATLNVYEYVAVIILYIECTGIKVCKCRKTSYFFYG